MAHEPGDRPTPARSRLAPQAVTGRLNGPEDLAPSYIDTALDGQRWRIDYEFEPIEPDSILYGQFAGVQKPIATHEATGLILRHLGATGRGIYDDFGAELDGLKVNFMVSRRPSSPDEAILPPWEKCRITFTSRSVGKVFGIERARQVLTTIASGITIYPVTDKDAPQIRTVSYAEYQAPTILLLDAPGRCMTAQASWNNEHGA